LAEKGGALGTKGGTLPTGGVENEGDVRTGITIKKKRGKPACWNKIRPTVLEGDFKKGPGGDVQGKPK